VAGIHTWRDNKAGQSVLAEMVVVAAAVGYGQTAFQPGRRAGCAEALRGQSLRVCLESLAKCFGRKSGHAAEMSGCLPDGFFDFRQLLQHQRMVKPTHLAGQYTRFRYNIVRRSARNRTDVDGQIANPAAVDARAAALIACSPSSGENAAWAARPVNSARKDTILGAW